MGICAGIKAGGIAGVASSGVYLTVDSFSCCKRSNKECSAECCDVMYEECCEAAVCNSAALAYTITCLLSSSESSVCEHVL